MLEYLKSFKLLMDIIEKARNSHFMEVVFKKIRTPERTAKVLVLGPGGTGKTSLGNFLSGKNTSILDPPGTYVTTLDFEDFDVESLEEATLEVAPGQNHRIEASWTHIERGIRSGTYDGMIFVTSYGYHSIGDVDYKSNPAYVSGNKTLQFLRKYIDQRQKIEIDLLNKVADCLKANNNRFWVLVFVGKKDLWWRERDDVEKHYSNGEFSSILGEISENKNHDIFRIELIYGSLEIQNFLTGRGVELAKNAAGYGQAQQALSMNELLDTVKALVRWKHGGE